MKGSRVFFCAVALVLLAGAVAIGLEPGDTRQWLRLAMGFEVLGGCLVLALIWTWRDRPTGRGWLLAVMLIGIALRLAVLPAGRELSDDAARYHWDGKAIVHGLNPYLYPPDDPAVAELWTDPVDDRINHPWNRTCYPPVAEALFAVGYLLSPGRLLGLQWLCLLAEIATWVLLARELARQRKSWSWLLLLSWSPLLVCQGYLPGHVDLLALPFVALLISATMAGHGARTGFWLAMACLVKPLPLLFLPAIMRELGLRRSRRALAAFGATILLAYYPFRSAGVKLFSSTWLMATDWSFNGSVAAGLERIMPMGSAHLIAGILTAMGIGIAAWQGRDFPARASGAGLAFAAFTPTLFPWYLVCFLPLLVLRPRPALIGLLIMIPLADIVVIDHQMIGLWHETVWVRWVQYVPFFGLLAWEAFHGRIFRHRRDFPRKEMGMPS